MSEADSGEFRRFLRVHVEGTFSLLRSVSAAMIRQELHPNGSIDSGRGATRGSIVTLGSGNSFVAAPHMVQYTTAKHAILGLTKNAGKFYPRLLRKALILYTAHTFSSPGQCSSWN
jgi:NAD(P)-dependent dehydrogenase (short-subunit alcohol dehydrogenase family)